MNSLPQTANFLSVALAMTARGAPVIPLLPASKSPPDKMKGWSANHWESTDAQQIESWAREWPTANCGAVCRPEGLLILDDDADFFLALMAAVRTLTVESRPGHRQYYFWQSERSRKLGNVAQGIGGPFSVRSSGYYGLAPGSIHDETREPYRIVQDACIAPIPDAVIDLIEQAIANRKKVPAPRTENGNGVISCGERNSTLTSLAGTMKHRSMSAAAILAALSAENKLRCNPPLPEWEIEKIAASVASYAPAPQEPRLILPAKVPPQAQPQKHVHFETLVSLRQRTPVETRWCVRTLIPHGGSAEVVGKVKSAGKSTYAMHLARAVVDGCEFLGQPCEQSPVIMLSEMPLSSLKPALDRAGLLAQPDFHLALWLDHDNMRIPWADFMDDVQTKALTLGAGLVIVDTLSQFGGLLGDQENNAGVAAEVFRPLQSLLAKQIAVLVCRHEKKGESEISDAGRGSTVFSGSVDVMMRLSRLGATHPVNFRRLTTLSRFEQTPPETLIELTPEGYQVRAEPGIVLEATRQLVLLHLPTTQQGARTESELEKATAQTRSTLQRVLGELMAAGIVKRSGSGKRGDPHRYYSAPVILKERGNLIV